MVSYNDYVSLSVTGSEGDEVRRSKSLKRVCICNIVCCITNLFLICEYFSGGTNCQDSNVV